MRLDVSPGEDEQRGWFANSLTVLLVLLAHVAVLVFAYFSKPVVVMPKRSEITIEIGSSPPPGSMGQGMLQAAAPVEQPEPAPIPEPVQEPAAEPEPQPQPVLQPEPKPEPIPEPILEPTPEPTPAPAPEPVPQPTPLPVPDPKPEPPPKPLAPLPKPAPRPAPTPAPPKASVTPPVARPTPTTPTPTPAAPSAPSAPAIPGGEGVRVVDADYKATYLRNPKPPYPALALKMRVEGTVTLRVLVQEDGTTGKVLLSKSSGNASLDQSALDTVAKWRFTPAKSQGKAIAQWVSIPIHFSMKRR